MKPLRKGYSKASTRVPHVTEAQTAKKFGQYLMDARKSAGFSLHIAAKKISNNWKAINVQELEEGVKFPSFPVLKRMCRVYEISFPEACVMSGRVPPSFLRHTDYDPELLLRGMRNAIKAYKRVAPRKGSKVKIDATTKQLRTFHRKYRRT